KATLKNNYSPCAHIFLFFVQWTDSHLVGALGLIRILIYKAYEDGKTTMSIHERKASIKEFYDAEERKQREICAEKYKRRYETTDKGKMSEIEIEREEECGICMEMNTKVVLPTCNHSLCMKCYKDWRSRSQSCPFCRDSLKRVKSGELWIYTSECDVIDLSAFARENIKRLFIYIDKLPLIVPDGMLFSYDPHI
ncbi:hypothetical protein PHJA_002645200, partial [Phtheirospermum japonicum]